MSRWCASRAAASSSSRSSKVGERARLKELEDEVRRLKTEREILKKPRRGLPACEARLHPRHGRSERRKPRGERMPTSLICEVKTHEATSSLHISLFVVTHAS
jgi:hypothetical protein